jgi:hypothetical protein
VRDVIQRMEEFRQRQGPTLGSSVTVRDLIDRGRRF